jgi:polysaccharide pyruvyl transferase WcaK-like protein
VQRQVTPDFKEFRISAGNKRICFWGAPEAANLFPPNVAAQMALSGHNSGNLFIGAGLFRNVDCELKEYHPGFGSIPPEELHNHYDCVFIAASNFVSASVDLTSAYDYLAKTKLQLFCFGLGSQFLPTQDVSLNPGTENFLRLLSERSGSIGVRGAFTAELLWRIGIKNLSLVGCPSLLSLKSNAVASLLTKVASTTKVGINFSNNVRRHALDPESLRATENALFRRMLNENSYYILQNEEPEISIFNSGTNANAQLKNEIATVTQIFGVADLASITADYLRSRLRIFFDVDVWTSSMRTMSASIGSRFHGNVAAILAGTPALFLAHDMRTQELCELFKFPYVTINRPYAPDELLELLLNSGYSDFIRKMKVVQTEWKLFLNRNGMDGGPAAGL